MQVVCSTPLHLKISSPPNVFRESDEMNYVRKDDLQHIEFPEFICGGRLATEIEEERYQTLVQHIHEIDQEPLHRTSYPFASIGLPEWAHKDNFEMELSSHSNEINEASTSVIQGNHLLLRKIFNRNRAVERETETQSEVLGMPSRIDWSSKYLGDRSIFDDTTPLSTFHCLRPRLLDSHYNMEDCHTPEQPILQPPSKVPLDCLPHLDFRSSIGAIDEDSLEDELTWMKQLEGIHTPTTDQSRQDQTSPEEHTPRDSILDPSIMLVQSGVSERPLLEETHRSTDTESATTAASDCTVSDLNRIYLNLGCSKFRTIAKHRLFDSLIKDPTLKKRQRIVSFNDNDLSKSSCVHDTVSFDTNLIISRALEGNDVVTCTDSDQGYQSPVTQFTRSASVMSYFLSSTIFDSSNVPLYNSSWSSRSNLCTNIFCPTPDNTEGFMDLADIANTTTTEEVHEATCNMFSTPVVTLKTPRSPCPVRYSKPMPIRLGMDIGYSAMSKNSHVQKYHDMLQSIHIHATHNVPKLRIRRSSSDNAAQSISGLDDVHRGELPFLCDLEDYEMA